MVNASTSEWRQYLVPFKAKKDFKVKAPNAALGIWITILNELQLLISE
jgi:hypothetical protein